MRYGLPDEQWAAARDEMRSVLVDRARQGCPITYGELAAHIGAARLEPRHRRFGALLEEVCDAEDAAGRPMLGSLVVKADTGMPGAGYFRGVRTLVRDDASERSAWEAELARVVAFWSATGCASEKS